MEQSVRVAIISDTHGELDQRIVRMIARCDCVAHAGDLGSRAVVALMRPASSVTAIVRGNNDVPAKWADADQRYLTELPLEATLDLPGGQLQIVHGDKAGSVKRRHDWLREHYPLARAIVYGHSHRLAVDTSACPWVLNPGVAGVARTFGGPSMLILTVRGEDWSVESMRYELPGQRSVGVGGLMGGLNKA